MRRRQYLKGSAVAATAGLAGCSGILGGGGGPAGVAKNWIQAANEGEEEKVEELTHPDSPLQEGLTFAIAIYDQADVTVNSTEVLSNEDDVAMVEVEVTAKVEDQENTDTSEMELHTDDGDWKVWNFGNSGGQ